MLAPSSRRAKTKALWFDPIITVEVTAGSNYSQEPNKSTTPNKSTCRKKATALISALPE